MRTPRLGLFAGGLLLLAAAALSCGGGGGGGGSGGSQISGSLSKGTNVQTAASGANRPLLACLGSWFGAFEAVAEESTSCGHVKEIARDIPVRLLLGGVVVQTTSTNGDGHFGFTNLAPGDYVLQLILPSGVISAPVIVQPGQVTRLTGELDVDCHDVDHDGSTTELSLNLHEDTDDGSTLDADETANGGEFDGEVHEGNGKVKKQHGHHGDRSDETDTEG